MSYIVNRTLFQLPPPSPTSYYTDSLWWGCSWEGWVYQAKTSRHLEDNDKALFLNQENTWIENIKLLTTNLSMWLVKVSNDLMAYNQSGVAHLWNQKPSCAAIWKQGPRVLWIMIRILLWWHLLWIPLYTGNIINPILLKQRIFKIRFFTSIYEIVLSKHQDVS